MPGERTLLYRGWIDISDIPVWATDTPSVKTICLRDDKVYIFRDEQEVAVEWRKRLPPLVEKIVRGLPPFWFIEYNATVHSFTLVEGI